MTAETLTTRVMTRDHREYSTADGDLVIARRADGQPGSWRVTAHSNDLGAEVTGLVLRNDAGFRGRQWESAIDGQQYATLLDALRAAVSIARQRADLAAFTRAFTTDLCACGHDGYDGHDMRSVPPTCMTTGCYCGVDDAQQDGATVHRVGRWVARIAPEPALLYHGLAREDRWSRERATYEGSTIVEVYDPRYTGEGFTSLGQFVGAWGARTLLDSGSTGRGGGLNMHGGVPEWRMDEGEFTALLGLIVRHGELSL